MPCKPLFPRKPRSGEELRDEETDKDPQRKRRHLESEKCARDLREFLQAMGDGVQGFRV